MDKKGQLLDMSIITSAGFVILFVLAASATLLGYVFGKKMGFGTFPLWQIIVTIVVEFIAAYVIVMRNQ
jgi:hypothetical protein